MQQNRMHIAVLCLDVDRFHEINDSVDLTTGDTVLREVGNRIRAALRTGDFVARRSSNEFAVAVVDIDNLGEVLSFMDRLAEALRQGDAAQAETERRLTVRCWASPLATRPLLDCRRRGLDGSLDLRIGTIFDSDGRGDGVAAASGSGGRALTSSGADDSGETCCGMSSGASSTGLASSLAGSTV